MNIYKIYICIQEYNLYSPFLSRKFFFLKYECYNYLTLFLFRFNAFTSKIPKKNNKKITEKSSELEIHL